MAQNFDCAFKLALIGDSTTGKTCMLHRFLSEDGFNPSSKPTVGIEYKTKNVTIDGRTVKLQIWDTAGDERFGTITSSYYRGAQGFVVLYDVTRKETFDRVDSFWLSNISAHAKPNTPVILVGNKNDKAEERAVTKEEGEELAQKNGCLHMESSAATGQNVEAAIYTLARSFLQGAGGGEQPAAKGGPTRQSVASTVLQRGQHARKVGWLTKQGGRWPHKWQRRWFVLSDIDVSYSAQDVEGDNIRGDFRLADIVRVTDTSGQTSEAAGSFEIQVKTGRVYMCRCSTPTEAAEWVKAIQDMLPKGR